MLSIALALLAPTADAQEVRVLHLSPDAPAVDVFVNGGTPAAITNLAFTQGTPYIALPAATYDFAVSPAGTTPNDAVIDVQLTLDPATKYTAVAIDEVASITPLALIDDDSGIAPGDTRFQIVHAAAAVGTVNVSVKGLGRVQSDFGFGESFVADLPAGEYTVQLDVDLDARPDFAFDVPNLGGGVLVDAFAVTDSRGNPFLLAYLPDGSTARVDGYPILTGVRVLHLSPDAPAVDVWVDGALAISNLAFEEAAGFLDIPAGRTRVEVVAAGTLGPAVIDATLPLKRDRDHTVVAFGNLANIGASVIRLRTCEDAVAGVYCIQALHGADGVGTVDLWDLTAGVQLVNGFGYGEQVTFGQTAGAWTLGLDADRDGTADFTFDIPNIGDRVNANVVAVLDATGPFLQVILEDGTLVRIDAN